MQQKELEELRNNFLSNTTLDLKFREAQLKSLSLGLTEMNEEFEEALKSDLGYSKYFSFAFSQVLCQASIQFMLKNIRSYAAKRPTDTLVLAGPATSYLLPQPLGLVLVMGAWNYPVYSVMPYLVAAIGAGDSVVIKPSESAPKCAIAMCKLIAKYLDQRFYRSVNISAQETGQIIKLPWDLIIYTGGPENGRNVLRGAAENLTKVILELGGKCPTIIDEDANLENAALRIAQAKFTNSGQTCVACDHCIVHKNVMDKFVALLIKVIKQFYGEDPEKSADYSRVINERHCQRLKTWLEECKGEVLHGGKAIKVDKRYFEPTLVKHPDPKSKVMTEEIFGPILPILEFTDINQVIKNIVGTGLKPLALYYYGKKNKDLVNRLTNSGAFVINESLVHGSNYHQPFGGVQNSGMGQVNGIYAFDACSHLKPVFEKGTLNFFPFSARYPPWTPAKEKVMRMSFQNASLSQNEVKRYLLILFGFIVLIVLVRHCGCCSFEKIYKYIKKE